MADFEKVEHPDHYQSESGIEALDVIQAFNLNFTLGSALKYILRAGKKPGESTMDDLQKARFYIDAEIQAEFKRQKKNKVSQIDLALSKPNPLVFFEDTHHYRTYESHLYETAVELWYRSRQGDPEAREALRVIYNTSPIEGRLVIMEAAGKEHAEKEFIDMLYSK